MRIAHTMIRVGDLDRSLIFYVQKIGMKLFRKESYPDGRFTLAFVGFGEEERNVSLELTYNWDTHEYQQGTAFGHIALYVDRLADACRRLESQGVKIVRAPGPMKSASPDRAQPERIAFIEDPDGYRIELIESRPAQVASRAGAR